jgi:hypothetical protein
MNDELQTAAPAAPATESSEQLKMRFAIVKLWSELKIKNAEDECIARIKHSAEELGFECFEILPDGRYIEDPERTICNDDVDFVLHLHYETPKNYDAFSIVALWNPPQFYVEWGYSRCSRNLLSHDDFLSCGSAPADAMVLRRIRDSPYNPDGLFTFYHSVHDVVHQPSLGEGNVFYAGINWDVLQGKGSRHGDLLKILDSTGVLKIYGPEIFHGVRVWNGFQSYQREIPFDGISMIHEISKVGISLVLSSQAHKDSELMSSRLFESVAAGALVIADENRFASRNFGDSLLYVDTREPPESTAKLILEHVEWAKVNPGKALAMIHRAQEIFSRNFSHRVRLKMIYDGLSNRKQSIRSRALTASNVALDLKVFFLLPECCAKTAARQMSNLKSQSCRDFQAVFCIDSDWPDPEKKKLRQCLQDAKPGSKLLESYGFGKGACSAPLGNLFLDIASEALGCDAFIIVAPNETIFSNHLFVLKTAMERDSDLACAASAMVIRNGADQCNHVYEHIDFGHSYAGAPQGFGRFIYRTSKLPDKLNLALPFLDARPQAAFIGANKILQLMPVTLRLDLENSFPGRIRNEALENEVIREFHPEALQRYFGFTPDPRAYQSSTSPLDLPNKRKLPIGRKIHREMTRLFRQVKGLIPHH